jgi:FkbM family methyltransferase
MSWIRQRLHPLALKVRERSGLLLTPSDDIDTIDRYLRRRLGVQGYRRLVADALRRDGGVHRLVVERNGVLWTTDMGDEVGAGIFTAGEYEGAAIRALQERIGLGVVVDVGANVGTTTLPFARAGHRVVAIEPVPDTFSMLQANVTENGLQHRVACAQLAISAERRQIEMFVTTGSGQAEVVHGEQPAFLLDGKSSPFTRHERVVVEGGPLVGLLEDLDVAPSDVALVWADVQGSERDVLVTGDALWTAGVPCYLEVSPYILGDRTSELVVAAVERFAGFVDQAGLLGNPHAPSRPIVEFPSFVSEIDHYTSVLLVHAE